MESHASGMTAPSFRRYQTLEGPFVPFTYDSGGRLLTSTESGGGLPQVTLTCGYDPSGDLTSITDNLSGSGGSGQGITTYMYDSSLRLTTITQSLSGVAGPQVVNSYDSGGLITGVNMTIGGTGQAVTTGNTYNATNDLVEAVHKVPPPAGSPPPPGGGGGFDTDLYTFDPAGRLTSMTYNDGSSTNTYSYDSSGQLTGSTGPVNATFTYDSGGNRHSTGYTTGAGNEMTSGGGYTYTYDNDGNTISKTQLSTGDVWTYSYHYENRLTSAVEKSSGGSTLEQVTYTYDALGRQIGVDTNGTQRWTVFNGSSADANPYADFGASGGLAMRYLYSPAVDEILARTDASANTAWYITNNVGSVEYVVSSSGTILDHIMYDDYGNITSESDPSDGDRFKFAGMQYDTTTALYYDHARYYDPNIGRFVSQDPKGFAAGDTNLYRYVFNSPADDTDPSGRGIGDDTAINQIQRQRQGTDFQKRAVDLGIQQITGTLPGDGIVVPGNPDFADVPDINKLPPMDWTTATVSHGQAGWETPIPNTGYALKLYYDGVKYTIAVVEPTNTPGHIADAIWYTFMYYATLGTLTGDTYVNYDNAVDMVGKLRTPR